jgi:hypothetical protein
MALSITHAYVSAVPDAGDASLVQPSDWNDTHDIAGLAAGVETFLGTPSSANLATAVTDETGSGALVFANTPTLVTPVLGAATGTSVVLSGKLEAASIELGHASANTLTASGGVLSIEGVALLSTATGQPLDADLTAIAALTTTAYGRGLLELADEDALEALLDTLPNLVSIQGRTVTLADAGFDVLAGWDDSGSAYKNFLLADITAEGTPASGDFFLMYGAEGDLRKVDFDDMPGGTPVAITIADEASDTTCFPLFATAATGDLGPKSNAGLIFNSSTGELGAKTLLLAQGTITDVATNLSGTVTWNDAADTFTAWKLNVTNTNSNAASKLIDLQVGSTTQFNVTRTGSVTATSDINTVTAFISSSGGNSKLWAGQFSGQGIIALDNTGIVTWAAGTVATGSKDLYLYRDAANTLASRNTTSSQTYNVYDTWASTTDYHRIAIKTARATLASVSGATVTATALIPDGAVIMGVTTKVTVTISGGTTTGFQVGTVADPDRWGEAVALTAGTSLDNTNWTAGTIEAFTAATDVIVTAVGGNFTGTGTIYLSVQYLIGQCD